MADSADYVKSLKPFQDILGSFEQEYRKAPTVDRPALAEKIMEAIRGACKKRGLKVAGDDALQKVCVSGVYLFNTAPKPCTIH